MNETAEKRMIPRFIALGFIYLTCPKQKHKIWPDINIPNLKIMSNMVMKQTFSHILFVFYLQIISSDQNKEMIVTRWKEIGILLI